MMILVTGGAGYIGSHTCVELLNRGYEIVIMDNFSNSKPDALDKIRKITGKDFKFYEADMCDDVAMDKIFAENKIDSVIHFAGYKAVGESVKKPLMYYRNNLLGTMVLCEAMKKYGCTKMLFSSSATVYGNPATVPIREDFPLSTTNPYGTTKLMIERILEDVVVANPDWSVVLLRYFNPIGAHKSGLIGENPNGIPNNLVPYVARVACGKYPEVHVFGNDYPTPDGTGVRDYIHVVDLALGHVKAMEKAMTTTGVNVYNLGTGKGYSVLDIIKAYEKACGNKIPYVIDPRRPGDIPTCYADPEKSFKELGWKATMGIEEMCEDSWRFTVNNQD
ncbi:MAG: UDP-glucose 4-epimerase GalE [Clostridia bacterium]|nr:UDP-glucose 4-epimerase GalE [Clostridia bacterium]